ncbi:hypothetical protein D4R86_04215 [bacterium]|nr:MAG: hypothetical protein D4R86_04215 [bacterium]
MIELQNYVHKKIDIFGAKYEGTENIKDLINLKLRFDNWFNKKIQAIHDYYKSSKEKERISYIIREGSFSIRLTFYRNGETHFHIDHYYTNNSIIKDANIIKEYCLDVGSVYFLESEFGWKIGKTTNIRRRKNIFDVKLPFKYAVRFHIKTSEKTKLEKYFHQYFKDKLINGEWFLISEDDIRNVAQNINGYKLSDYSPDNKIYIDRKYLEKIFNKPTKSTC